MDPDNGGLFAINLSDEEETKPRPPRKTHQTDAEFQAVKKSYSAKVENGNVRAAVAFILRETMKHGSPTCWLTGILVPSHQHSAHIC